MGFDEDATGSYSFPHRRSVVSEYVASSTCVCAQKRERKNIRDYHWHRFTRFVEMRQREGLRKGVREPSGGPNATLLRACLYFFDTVCKCSDADALCMSSLNNQRTAVERVQTNSVTNCISSSYVQSKHTNPYEVDVSAQKAQVCCDIMIIFACFWWLEGTNEFAWLSAHLTEHFYAHAHSWAHVMCRCHRMRDRPQGS